MNQILKIPVVTVDLSPEPVTLQEAKDWMAITHNEEDQIITDITKAARQMIEKYTGLSFGQKQITAVIQMDGCGTPYNLPMGPTIQINGITSHVAFESNDALLDGSDYALVAGLLHVNTAGLMEIDYLAGFQVLPEELKEDILRVTAWLFQNRGIRYESETEPLPYPEWSSLAANKYVQTVV